jgi:transcriptional regulator with XRE-family HTH domain
MKPHQIKAALKRRKMTQRELAILTGKTEHALSRIINGHTLPHFDTIRKIEKVLEGK